VAAAAARAETSRPAWEEATMEVGIFESTTQAQAQVSAARAGAGERGRKESYGIDYLLIIY
jgi:hypothetical protein